MADVTVLASHNRTDTMRQGRTPQAVLFVGVVLLYVAMAVTGITWGLPTRAIDKYLFGSEEPWSGEKIYRLAGAGEKFSPTRGADVDVDPLKRPDDEPILLTGTEEDVAKIYLRYRLYTYQPDEMITMMALAGMRPGELNFDPRLYQYGGLFIYPVGVLIRLCGAVGLINVRSDVVYYLDHPDEFGKFYVVSRAYSALWGLIGVIVVFAIARRLGAAKAGVLAALLFVLMPVVVCMSHEGKPHLPGAVLMLLAVYFGMRCVARAADFSPRGASTGVLASGSEEGARSRGLKSAARRNFWLMCLCCGAALGMVINTWPIFVLIPLVAWFMHRRTVEPEGPDHSDAVGEFGLDVFARPRGLKSAARWSVGGVALGFAVYLATNPYIVINLFTNREVLRSNFGNSLAMYEISRVFEGFVRALQLTVEGATLPILVFGVVALVIALVHKGVREANKLGLIAVLAVPAGVFFLQFCLIGAGKPAEYGRFGIFPNTALAIGAACLLSHRWTTKLRDIVNWLPAGIVVIWVAVFGAAYLANFEVDARPPGDSHVGSRLAAAAWYERNEPECPLGVTSAPAPYCCPPLPFDVVTVYLVKPEQVEEPNTFPNLYSFVRPVDWIGLPMVISSPATSASPPFRFYLMGTPLGSTWLPRLTPISWANKPIVFENWIEP